MLLAIIYSLILLSSFIGLLLYYVVDSFRNKEYGYTIAFSLYATFILWWLSQAVKVLITMI